MKKNKEIAKAKAIERNIDERREAINILEKQIASINDLLFTNKIFGMDKNEISKTMNTVFEIKNNINQEWSAIVKLLGEEQ